jgi:hypothetical protein
MESTPVNSQILAEPSIEEEASNPVIVADQTASPKKPETYQEQQVRLLSRAVVLIAVGIFFVQVVWIILRFTLRKYYDYYNTNEAVFWSNFSISVCLALAMLFCGYYGTRYNNPSSCCLGVGYLNIYEGICVFGAAWSLFFSIWFTVVYGNFLTFIVDIVLGFMYIVGIGRADSLLHFLSAVHKNTAEEEVKKRRRILTTPPFPEPVAAIVYV